MLEAVRVGVHKNLFCPVEQALLIKVLTHQLWQGKSGVLTLCRIEINLSRKIIRILDESIVELIFVSLEELPLVLDCSPMHVPPLIELHNQVASACRAEILRGNIRAEDLITYGSCHCAAALVVSCNFESHPERLLSLHLRHHRVSLLTLQE